MEKDKPPCMNDPPTCGLEMLIIMISREAHQKDTHSTWRHSLHRNEHVWASWTRLGHTCMRRAKAPPGTLLKLFFWMWMNIAKGEQWKRGVPEDTVWKAEGRWVTETHTTTTLTRSTTFYSMALYLVNENRMTKRRRPGEKRSRHNLTTDKLEQCRSNCRKLMPSMGSEIKNIGRWKAWWVRQAGKCL